MATKYLDILLQAENRQLFLKEKCKSAINLSGDCVISSVLSHHGKNLKWCTSVTVGYSSVLFSKQRIVHPRDMTVSQPQRKGLNLSWLPPFISLSSPPCPLSLSYANWDGQKVACLFHLKFSLWSMDFPLLHFHELFSFLSFSDHHFGLLFPILTT